MIGLLPSLRKDRRGAAAAEMALLIPLLLTLLFGSLELGNYFMNEHTLVKAVRDGARFAARQNFTNYTSCSGSPGGTVVADTRDLVISGTLSGGTVITPNITAGNISVTNSCMADAGGQPMAGIYTGRADGAQIVTVRATVAYRPVMSAFGFRGIAVNLNAASQAAVAGL